MKADLYRCRWMSDYYPGYVVYRNSFDLNKCSIQEGVAAHKVALFVDETDAREYCAHRNRMIDKYGTDDISDAYDMEGGSDG